MLSRWVVLRRLLTPTSATTPVVDIFFTWSTVGVATILISAAFVVATTVILVSAIGLLIPALVVMICAVLRILLRCMTRWRIRCTSTSTCWKCRVIHFGQRNLRRLMCLKFRPWQRLVLISSRRWEELILRLSCECSIVGVWFLLHRKELVRQSLVCFTQCATSSVRTRIVRRCNIARSRSSVSSRAVFCRTAIHTRACLIIVTVGHRALWSLLPAFTVKRHGARDTSNFRYDVRSNKSNYLYLLDYLLKNTRANGREFKSPTF